MKQKVTLSIKVPSQTVKIDLTVPELEVEDLITNIVSQCEPYENFDFDDVEDSDEDFVDEDSYNDYDEE